MKSIKFILPLAIILMCFNMQAGALANNEISPAVDSAKDADIITPRPASASTDSPSSSSIPIPTIPNELKVVKKIDTDLAFPPSEAPATFTPSVSPASLTPSVAPASLTPSVSGSTLNGTETPRLAKDPNHRSPKEADNSAVEPKEEQKNDEAEVKKNGASSIACSFAAMMFAVIMSH